MKFKIIYLFFIVCAFLYGSYHIAGPLTLRQVAAILMCVICLFESKTFYIDKYLKGYFVFVAFWLISSLATGNIVEYFQDLIGFVFVAYIGYWATIILKKKYDSLHILVYALIFIGMFDAVITICQSLYIPVFDSFLELLHLEPVNEKFLSKQSREVDMMFVAIPGLYGSPVNNGHYLMISFITSFALQRYHFKPVGLVFSIIILVGLFFCQQRGPFYLGVLLLTLILYVTYFRGKSIAKKVLMAFIVIAIAVLAVPTYLQNSSLLESRMSRGAEDEVRSELYANTPEWLAEHPLGGIYELRKIRAPHNFFLNAFVIGGWLGGMFVIYVLFVQLKPIAKVCLKTVSEKNYLTFIFAVAYLGITGNSMVHNVSIITGDVASWIIWAAFLSNKQSKNQCLKGWKLFL